MLTSKNTKPRTKKKGFTLLEVIISFALISILLIPISNMILSSVKINKMTENKQQAKALLQDTVENIKLIDKLPETMGENVTLDNGVTITRTEDIVVDEESKATYAVASSENDKGFSIEGTIRLKSVTSSNENNKKLIDRAIYFNNGLISVSDASSKIETALNKGAGYLAVKGDSIAIKVDDTGKINMVYGESENEIKNEIKNEINIASPENNALLICLDDEKNDLKVSINNESATKQMKVYLYKKGESSKRDDITLLDFKGQLELITGILKDSEVKNTRIYSVELKAKKNNEAVETMSFDVIK
ncbi:type II secretion system protein [Clostridium sp.]|uniref:type II secretion system protein n=1 Tax=Clostridium sp. TaxID=1506 RepID=UPI003216864F